MVSLVLVAAIINVPWALTFMRSRDTVRQVPSAEFLQLPPEWPVSTPHVKPWPAPESWSEGRVFGCRVFDVRTKQTEVGRNAFAMEAQLLGWPLPVIEDKQMWWDWDDPALKGPESDPAPTLRLQGLLLNPLILGGGVWAVIVLPWLIAIVATRRWRYQKRRCMDCGYPIGVNVVCTECGRAVRRRSDQAATPPSPSSTA